MSNAAQITPMPLAKQDLLHGLGSRGFGQSHAEDRTVGFDCRLSHGCGTRPTDRRGRNYVKIRLAPGGKFPYIVWAEIASWWLL